MICLWHDDDDDDHNVTQNLLRACVSYCLRCRCLSPESSLQCTVPRLPTQSTASLPIGKGEPPEKDRPTHSPPTEERAGPTSTK